MFLRCSVCTKDLADVVADNFEVKFCSSSSMSSAWSTCKSYPNGESYITMYGFKINAQLAAYAFTLFFDRIQVLALQYRVSQEEYEEHVRKEQKHGYSHMSKSVFTRVARKSYMEGMVRRMELTVKRSLTKRAAKRDKALKVARKRARALERALHGSDERSNSYKTHKSSSRSGGVDKAFGMSDADGSFSNCALKDVEDAKEEAKRARKKVSKLEREERNAQALVIMTKSAPERALQEAGITISGSRSRTESDLGNPKAYQKGKADAAGFDLNRRAIDA